MTDDPRGTGVALPPMEREGTHLVDPAQLPPALLRDAGEQAELVNFRDVASLLNHGRDALAESADVSRRLYEAVSVGQAGEVAAIAAAALDGLKILRIGDMLREAHDATAGRAGAAGKPGWLARALHLADGTKGATAGFREGRAKFAALMDRTEARAQVRKAELLALISTLDGLAEAVHAGVASLTVTVAAAQIALGRGYDEEDALRARALGCADPGLAVEAVAEVMEFRGNLATFRARTATLRDGLAATAALAPTIGASRRAAAAYAVKIDTGLLATFRNLQAAALAAGESVVRQGTHEGGAGAARGSGMDPRDVEGLKQVADQSAVTLNGIIAADRERDAAMATLRDGLAAGP